MGIASLSAAYVAIGIVVLLVFTIANIVACCTRRKVQKESRNPPGCCSRFCSCIFGARLWYTLGSAVLIGLTAAALSQTGKFASEETKVLNTLDAVSDLFSNAVSNADTVIVPSLQSSQYNANLLSDTLIAQNLTTPATAMANIATATGNAAATASSLSSFINTVNSFIANDDSGIKSSVAVVRTGGIAFSALLLVYLFLNFLTATISKPCCARTFRCMQPIYIIFVFLTFLFSAGFLAGSLIGSDACINPATSIHKVMVYVNSANATVDTIDYYTACISNPSLPVSGAAAEVINAQAVLTTALNDLDSFITTNKAQSWYTGEIATNITALNTTLYTTAAGLSAISIDVSCSSVGPHYIDMRQVACNDGTFAVIAAWILGSVVSVVLTFMSISAVRLCKNHPGDPKSPDDRAFDADSYVTRMSLPTTSAPNTTNGNAAVPVSAAPILMSSGTAASYGSYAAAQDWASRR